MAKWDYFVGRKTALPTKNKTKTHHPLTENPIVGYLAMAAAIHFRLHFLNMGSSIQSSLEISGWKQLDLVSRTYQLLLYNCSRHLSSCFKTLLKNKFPMTHAVIGLLPCSYQAMQTRL